MSERNDKWLMFKNYLHNELGITKDDIRAWLKEPVQSQAELMLQKKFDDFDMDKFVRNHILTQMRYWTTDEVRRQVASLLADRLVILSTDTERRLNMRKIVQLDEYEYSKLANLAKLNEKEIEKHAINLWKEKGVAEITIKIDVGRDYNDYCRIDCSTYLFYKDDRFYIPENVRDRFRKIVKKM